MELCIQLAVIMVGQQAYNGIIEMLIPWFNTLRIRRWLGVGSKEREAAGGSAPLAPACRQWTEDYKLLDWGPRGLFYEYLEMVMQYGFVTLFVTAFPLAPVFALLNNVFEMRLDAKKFLKFYRRPVPRRAPDIGAFIIAFSSNFVPRLVYMVTVSGGDDSGYLEHSLSYFDTTDFAPGTAPRQPTVNATMCRLAFIVIFQNVVSVVMIGVQWCIPDVPSKLRDRIKREAYLTNELIIRHETEARSRHHPPPPLRSPSSTQSPDPSSSPPTGMY
ncbi:hypothetical protein AAG570_007380 [Ranatra chinensis]|uniref:Anoctamin n=1 Tax=Ranatra chinensis TaxID=642074 RepID=A0ABD0XXK5_9HEMI